ncbi:hypothetical protein CLOP_g1005 [Closterium sp. NIES-67]|nr:hypothetical protein CLOP_g1005 [Closterium sp. NIES-67]
MAMVGAPKAVDGAANSSEVQQLAQFAVDQHNKKQNSDLKLVSVQSASQQVVAGTMHRIKLTAQLPGATPPVIALYEAAIWEKPWEGFKELQSFDKIDSA